MKTSVDKNEEIIRAIQAGDSQAFARWMKANQPWVRGVVFGVLGRQDRVEDVAQQVWTSAWERIGDLRDPERWKTWLYAIARHAALDAGRDATRRRRSVKFPSDHEPPIEGAPTPDEMVIDAERRRKVMQAIEALPPIYREPFVLRHLEGWSYKRIADVMGMPVDSVETRLVRAMRMMRETLKKEGWST